MMTGRVVFIYLLWRSCAGNGVLLSRGTVLNFWKLVVGTILVTSAEELLDDLDLPLNEAMTSWVVRAACSHGESPLVCKFLILFAVKLGTVVTVDFFWSAKYPKTETQGRNNFFRRHARHFLYIRKSAVVISNQKVIFVTLDYSIPNAFQGLLGTSIGISGYFCCEALIVWHGTEEWTCLAMSLLMFDQNMLPFALNVILVTPGWPLWSTFKQWPLNVIGMKNLPFQVVYEC